MKVLLTTLDCLKLHQICQLNKEYDVNSSNIKYKECFLKVLFFQFRQKNFFLGKY